MAQTCNIQSAASSFQFDGENRTAPDKKCQSDEENMTAPDKKCQSDEENGTAMDEKRSVC